MSKGTNRVLLTGASGVVGRAMIDALADDYDVVALRHRRPIEDARVTEVVGTLDEPGFGLPEGQLAELAAGVDAVLHCGAATGWRSSRDHFFDTNVAGTRRAVEFAERADAVFYHMSTAFVQNHVDEEQGGAEGPMAYVASKTAAEKLVADSGIRHVMVRPSIFIGDSADGRILAFQGIYQVSGAILKDALPVLPADPANLIDYIPQDLVGRAVHRLLERDTSSGEYWLTAGAAAATLGDMVRTTLEVAEELGISPHPPRLVPASMVDRLLIPLLDDVMTPALRRLFKTQLELLHLFQHRTALPSSLADLGIEVSRESQVEAFRRSTEYWALKNNVGDASRVGRGRVRETV